MMRLIYMHLHKVFTGMKIALANILYLLSKFKMDENLQLLVFNLGISCCQLM